MDVCFTKVKSLLFVLIVLLLFTGCGKVTYQTISQEEAQMKMEYNEAVLIDVRSHLEFNDDHIDGAVNMPIDTIYDVIVKQISKDTPIILYCRSGSRSKTAANGLIELGYTKVYDLGSIDNWR